MNIWAKIFQSGLRETVDSVGNVVDKLTTTNEEKSDAKNQLSEIVISHLTRLTELQSGMLLAEASGNWLQRSWRPLLMLSFGFVILYSKFFAPAFSLPNTDLEPSFWSLLEIGLGGYVIGRSVEKVADTVTKNIDLPIIRKKDRKE